MKTNKREQKSEKRGLGSSPLPTKTDAYNQVSKHRYFDSPTQYLP